MVIVGGGVVAVVVLLIGLIGALVAFVVVNISMLRIAEK